jgi:hypothetical protein
MPTIASIGMVAKDAQGNQSSSWAQENSLFATALNRMRRANLMDKWNPQDEKCRKCLSVKDYQKGRIPPCEIEKMCIHGKEYEKYLKGD